VLAQEFSRSKKNASLGKKKFLQQEKNCCVAFTRKKISESEIISV